MRSDDNTALIVRFSRFFAAPGEHIVHLCASQSFDIRLRSTGWRDEADFCQAVTVNGDDFQSAATLKDLDIDLAARHLT